MRITFLRHAHTHHAGDDQNRVLSPKGIAQALHYKKLINNSAIKYDMVICSSAVRTRETADIIFYNSHEQVPRMELSGLYLPDNDLDVIEISKSLMLYPLATPAQILQRDKTNSWQRYADQAFAEVKIALRNIGSLTQSSHVLIVGHGTILNLVVLRFAPEMEFMKYRYIGHLEGVSIYDIPVYDD